MTVWDELKVTLVRLRDQEPGSLLGYPMPEVDEGRHPPFSIRLAAWATSTAEELHRRFGDDVELTVGALAYPSSRQPPPAVGAEAPAELLDPAEISAELDGPAVVKSGETLWHGLLLSNRTGQDVQVATNGQVTATVVDLANGQVVGGFSGAQRQPLVVFRVAAGQSERIPMLIGTDSTVPQIGYVIPPGDWGIQVTLTLGPHPRESPRRRTPILPLTVTARDPA